MKKYDFSLGQIVTNKVSVFDEMGNEIPADSKLRIIAITPKVRYTSRHNIDHFPKQFDSRRYFLNLVRVEQQDYDQNRIRVNFVTVQKLGKNNST